LVKRKLVSGVNTTLRWTCGEGGGTVRAKTTENGGFQSSGLEYSKGDYKAAVGKCGRDRTV
jgi:hypothetical protein